MTQHVATVELAETPLGLVLPAYRGLFANVKQIGWAGQGWRRG